ncbi:MAG: hypothetical protein AB7U38_04445 [Hyphomicrobiales bacterium]
MKLSVLTLALAASLCAGAFSGTASAAEAADDSQCGKKIGAQGAPSPIQSIASMNAIQLWIELAREQNGPDSAMWHNAGGGLVKCERIRRSSVYHCYATGKPCPMPEAATTATAAKTR